MSVVAGSEEEHQHQHQHQHQYQHQQSESDRGRFPIHVEHRRRPSTHHDETETDRLSIDDGRGRQASTANDDLDRSPSETRGDFDGEEEQSASLSRQVEWILATAKRKLAVSRVEKPPPRDGSDSEEHDDGADPSHLGP